MCDLLVRQRNPELRLAEFVHTESSILMIGAHAGHVGQSVRWRAIDDDFRAVLGGGVDGQPPSRTSRRIRWTLRDSFAAVPAVAVSTWSNIFTTFRAVHDCFPFSSTDGQLAFDISILISMCVVRFHFLCLAQRFGIPIAYFFPCVTTATSDSPAYYNIPPPMLIVGTAFSFFNLLFHNNKSRTIHG